jgi:hypothetical protein
MGPFDFTYNDATLPTGHVLTTLFPDGLSDDYVVLDTKTSGSDPTVDLVVAISLLIVEKGKVVRSEHRLLNWDGLLNEGGNTWLAQRLEKLHKRDFTREDLRQGGPAKNVLLQWAEIFVKLPPTMLFVGHSLHTFKWPMLASNWEKFLGVPPWPVLLCDLGLVEKALGAGMYPDEGESLDGFQSRVHGDWVPGVRWSFDYCVDRHGARPALSQADPLYRVVALQGIYESHRAILAEQISSDSEVP